ncbi:hypothetical protein [Eubacterium sp. 1001713B170207_170306_E7]|uniref:hypothetical protein n=1 Tax=Eubacterium sp. 1001713B170207_170306_E7 TaxID=2787097 RepID=UPI00189BF4D6|nr:hypothetical protein [Eubacterium sp. 1001713B170207_170306_E7]
MNAENNESMQCGDYAITRELCIGDKTVVLGEKPGDYGPDRYLCAYRQVFLFYAQYSEIETGAYLDMMDVFTTRVKAQIEQARETLSSITVPMAVIIPEMCCPDDPAESIEGKVIAIKPEVLRPECQSAVYQLGYVTGGFGAHGTARGNAVFIKKLYSQEDTRFERSDVQGIVKPECLPEWAKKNLEKIKQRQKKEKNRKGEAR